MNASNTVLRLLAALALCSLAGVATLVGGPPLFRLVAIGLFVMAAPGLLLVSMLRVRDPLLSLVVGMATGPAAWAILATALTYVGLWWPGPTVAVAAAALAVWAIALLVLEVRTTVDPPDEVRHRFAAHLHDEVIIRAVGRHRGAFPFR